MLLQKKIPCSQMQSKKIYDSLVYPSSELKIQNQPSSWVVPLFQTGTNAD
jgi:hypothetical protein